MGATLFCNGNPATQGQLLIFNQYAALIADGKIAFRKTESGPVASWGRTELSLISDGNLDALRMSVNGTGFEFRGRHAKALAEKVYGQLGGRYSPAENRDIDEDASTRLPADIEAMIAEISGLE